MTINIEERRISKDFKPDEAFVWRAIDQANLNALRMAIYQQTKDPRLADIRIEEKALRGGALIGYSVAKEDREKIRDIAAEFLLSGPHDSAPLPNQQQSRELMEMFIGHPISDIEADYGYEELAFEEFPRDAKWTKPRPKVDPEEFRVTIIGAGISGLAMGIQLNRLGIPYTIFDKLSGVGGTWVINDYPQARVDISTFLYQFKFDKNYPWKSHFATQSELREYTEYIADEYDVRPHINLNTELLQSDWHEADQKWHMRLRNSDGQEFEHSSNAVISCTGLFGTPNLPNIEGIETFEGKMFHTTAWDHDFDLRGKSVALIGTGSTGCQLAPGVAEEVDHMSVFQRTPSWITPVQGYRSTVTDEKRWLFDALPGYWNWFVYSAYIAEVPMQGLQTVDPEWVSKGGVVNQRNTKFREALTEYIRSKFPDEPQTAEKCIPDYPPLARRLVIDNGFYDTLARDNVELVSEGIERITRTGILTKDGIERKFDLIILSAGFQVSKYLWPVQYKGRDDTTPDKLWEKDGARAHLGLTMPGFPNFFVCYGPNAQSRAGGFHDWAEIWGRYIGELMVHMIENGYQSMEVKPESFDDYNDRMDAEHSKLLWESEGVGGYYVNQHGRSGVNMPWTMHEFYNMIRVANPDDFNWK